MEEECGTENDSEMLRRPMEESEWVPRSVSDPNAGREEFKRRVADLCIFSISLSDGSVFLHHGYSTWILKKGSTCLSPGYRSNCFLDMFCARAGQKITI